jgi:subtilisin family serine protease
MHEGNSHNEKKYPKEPDQDPMDFHGHGTHVAGIIAAENEW